MRRVTQLAVACAAWAIASAGQVRADVMTLSASDTASVSMQSGKDTWNDNMVRAYYYDYHIDGFMKFDLTAIPDNATINQLTLGLHVYYDYGGRTFDSPYGDPQVRVYRSAYDAWHRGGTNFPTTLD